MSAPKYPNTSSHTVFSILICAPSVTLVTSKPALQGSGSSLIMCYKEGLPKIKTRHKGFKMKLNTAVMPTGTSRRGPTPLLTPSSRVILRCAFRADAAHPALLQCTGHWAHHIRSKSASENDTGGWGQKRGRASSACSCWYDCWCWGILEHSFIRCKVQYHL